MAREARQRKTSTGRCDLCGQSYTKASMSRHLPKCMEQHPPLAGEWRGKPLKPKRLFHLRVEGSYNPEYWMNIELPASATLVDLDQFLRDTWLECCGHLSAFKIEGQDYSTPSDEFLYVEDMLPMSRLSDEELKTRLRQTGIEPNDEAQMDDLVKTFRAMATSSSLFDLPTERSMNFPLDRVLRPGLKFEHQYDFGSTTYLTLKVVGERTIPRRGNGVEILARNHPPAFTCEGCGQPATRVCFLDEDPYQIIWCRKCAEEHGFAAEMWLPLVNSPRVGVCGYSGPEDEWSDEA